MSTKPKPKPPERSATSRSVRAPALPFVPFHVVALSEEDIRRALAGRSEDYVVRAVMQLLSGEMWGAVHGMAAGDERAQGEFRALQGLYAKVEQLVRMPV